MGCCQGKESGNELQLKSPYQLDQTGVTQTLKEGSNSEIESAEAPAVTRVNSQRNSSIFFRSPVEEAISSVNLTSEDTQPTHHHPIALPESHSNFQERQANKISLGSTVFDAPNQETEMNSLEEFKQKRLFTVVNGAQLRIRFGPLSTINEEQSQVDNTNKMSEASRNWLGSNFNQ